MGNFKVKVNTPEESKEAQELFFKLGGKWGLGGCKIQNTDEPYLYLENGLVLYGFSVETFNTEQHKELTLAELRDMVVLKRNDVNDATHESGFFKYVELADGWYYFEDKWLKSAGAKPEYYEKLQEINMSTLDAENHENPSLRDRYLEQAKKINDACASVFKKQDELLTTMLNHSAASINDQYAEIEKARQHRHYFIDVSDVDEIDFYEIALRYNVTDPCIQHILKKCLAVGQRGQKDFHHDLKDIYDTAKRMLAVHGLDS